MPTAPAPGTAIPGFRVPPVRYRFTVNKFLSLKFGRFAFISKPLNMQFT